jgi:hypothetical protein
MRWLGLLILALVGGVLTYERTSYYRSKAEEYCTLAACLEVVYGEIDTFLSSPPKIEQALAGRSEIGIKERATIVSSPSLAFDLPIEKRDAERVFDYFEALGKSHPQSEREKAKVLAAHLKKRGEEERDRLDARIRAIHLVYGTALACAVMLAV